VFINEEPVFSVPNVLPPPPALMVFELPSMLKNIFLFYTGGGGGGGAGIS
jgi:hypothetical protein